MAARMTPSQTSLFGDEPRETVGAATGARTTDPATSHAAAQAAVVGFSRYVYQVLWLYAGGGSTDEAAWKRTAEFDNGQWRQGTVSKRRHRAMVKGLIEDTGVTEPLDSGLEGIVWCVTEKGRQHYASWLREAGDPRRAQ